MLKSVDEQAKYCYDRAAEARRRALKVVNAEARGEFFASEARWLKLAESWELSAWLTSFVSPTTIVPEHPMCADCNLPTWLVEIQSGYEARSFVFECKVCETRQSVTETNV